MTSLSTTARKRRLNIAGVLLLIQGVIMEAPAGIGLLVLIALGLPEATITDRVEIFAHPFLQANLYLMMAMSGIFAALRIIGAIAMMRNELWGLVLSAINAVVTLTLMVWMLPAGIADGLLSGGALVLMLLALFGGRAAIRETPAP